MSKQDRLLEKQKAKTEKYKLNEQRRENKEAKHIEKYKQGLIKELQPLQLSTQTGVRLILENVFNYVEKLKLLGVEIIVDSDTFYYNNQAKTDYVLPYSSAGSLLKFNGEEYISYLVMSMIPERNRLYFVDIQQGENKSKNFTEKYKDDIKKITGCEYSHLSGLLLDEVVTLFSTLKQDDKQDEPVKTEG